MSTYRAGSNAASTADSRIRGASPQPTYTANSPSGAVTWSDGGAGGSFTGTNPVVYTPRNKTQTVTISATDSANTKTIALAVKATLPIYPQVNYEFELDIETKQKDARDGTHYFREDGSMQSGWVFAWTDRVKEDKAELVDFWKDHRKVVQFYTVDKDGNLMNLVWFISSIKAVFQGQNRWAMSAAVKGIFTNSPAP